MSRLLKTWLVLIALVGLSYGGWIGWRNYTAHASATTPRRRAANPPVGPPLKYFTLTDQQGQPFDSSTLRGQVWVTGFFFTNCPNICWRMNQALSAIQQTSPESTARYLSITCDPDNDTPEVLDRYAQNFKADARRWTFLTGDFDYIRRVALDLFKLPLEKETHSSKVAVVDRQGQLRGWFTVTEPQQLGMLRSLVAKLEAEPAPDELPDVGRLEPQQPVADQDSSNDTPAQVNDSSTSDAEPANNEKN